MITTYFKNTVMDNLFHTTASTALPEKYYFAWSPTAVTDTDDGAGFTEPLSSTGYARTEFTGATNAVNGMITNAKKLDFSESISSQGITMAYGLYDNPTNGNLLIYEKIADTDQKTMDKGTTLYIKPGEVKFTLKGI